MLHCLEPVEYLSPKVGSTLMGPSNPPGQPADARQHAHPEFAREIIDRLFEFSPDAILVTDRAAKSAPQILAPRSCSVTRARS